MKTRFIVEVAIFTAIGVILDVISSMLGVTLWANGGSISLSMIPIFIISYKYGIKGGVITGFLVGVLQLLYANSGYLLHPIQIALDYYVAYALVGLSGVFAKNIKNEGNPNLFILYGVLLGGTLRLVSHLGAGYIWWNTWAPEGMNVNLYVFLYNASYMIPSMIVCYLILVVTVKRLRKYIIE